MLQSVSPTYPRVKHNLHVPFSGEIPILLRMSLGDQIKRARADLNISQTAIAKRFGISRAAVAQWENGTTRPETDKLVELAAILKISLTAMLEGNDEGHPPKQKESYGELIAAWELLTQEQRQEHLAQIKKQVDSNMRVYEQLSASSSIKEKSGRVVRESDRRQANLPVLHDLRKKGVQ